MEKAASGPFFRRLPILVGIGGSYFFFFFARDEKGTGGGGEEEAAGQHSRNGRVTLPSKPAQARGLRLLQFWRCASAACGRMDLQYCRHLYCLMSFKPSRSR